MSQTDRQDEIDSCQALALLAEQLADRLMDHLIEYPSNLLSHHRSRAGDIADACRRQIDRIGREVERAAEREERKAAHQQERKYDAHTKAMAEQMGITPEAFLELQAERRRGMRGAPGTVNYSPDHEVIR